MMAIEMQLATQARSLRGRIWMQELHDKEKVASMCAEFGLSTVIARILSTRNVGNVDNFLHPTLKRMMPDPYSLLDVDKAIERITIAMDRGDKIALFGDYDVDGATSCAVMYKYLCSVGADVEVYIPDRFVEGYGPSIEAFAKLLRMECSLCITLDCGTMAFAEIGWAMNNGLDIIVIDHHQADEQVPPCIALVNPNRRDQSVNGTQNLAAVGVAYLVIVALNAHCEKSCRRYMARSELYKLLDLVALGTVCDVMHLVGLNRAYVARGLHIMKQSDNVGLRALMQVGRIKPSTLNARHLGYVIGPRINAGGRIGKSRIGFELLAAGNPIEAQRLADEADACNKERGDLEASALREAELQIVDKIFLMPRSSQWSQGVIGIVAGRIKDMLDRPVAVVHIDSDGNAKASCRSIKGLDFGAAVAAARECNLITKGGGHEAAAGFSTTSNKLDELEEFLTNWFSQRMSEIGGNVTKHRTYDLAISVGDLTLSLVKELTLLEPFGHGNRHPIFLLEHVTLHDIRIAKEKHAFFQIAQRDRHIKGSMFKLTPDEISFLMQVSANDVSLIGHVESEEYKDIISLRFTVEDVLCGR